MLNKVAVFDVLVELINELLVGVDLAGRCYRPLRTHEVELGFAMIPVALHPQGPIKSAILDRFAHMIGRDRFCTGEISDGA